MTLTFEMKVNILDSLTFSCLQHNFLFLMTHITQVQHLHMMLPSPWMMTLIFDIQGQIFNIVCRYQTKHVLSWHVHIKMKLCGLIFYQTTIHHSSNEGVVSNL